MMQICVFNKHLFSLHNTLIYAIHGACLRMVLLTDVYTNLTSLCIKPQERAFKQFKSPVLSVLTRSNKMQQYAGIYLLHNYSKGFGCPSHPLSGVHKTVTAASGTGHITYLGNNLPPAWSN